MVKIYMTTLVMLIAAVFGIRAQVTTNPYPLQIDSPEVTVFFHADEGNKGLMGTPATSKIYAHTGVITNLSSSPSEWKYAPTWGADEEKYELSYVSENLWQLYIGDIRTFYGITNPDEVVEKLAFVFKSPGSSNPKVGKTASDDDIFVDVLDSGLQISVESSAPFDVLVPATANVEFNIYATENADLKIDINGTTVAAENNTNFLSFTYLFSDFGSYTVTVTANNDEGSVEKVLNYILIGEAVQADYPGGTPKMGPVKNPDGSVTFCLGALEKQNVVLVGAWNNYECVDNQIMYYQDVITPDKQINRYFWVTVDGLDNDTMYGYYFIVDGTYAVGDPYARLVLDPWNDKSLLTDVFPNLPAYPWNKVSSVPVAVYQGSINDYDWQVEEFKGVAPENLVIYELLFRDFTGTEGKADGNGTVRQAIEKFDYLKELGINAIELLPIMEFNGNNSWGYNPNFYFAVDKAYGTPSDYKEFIDLCHQNGIAVILDMVFNQSDGLHPWYQMYSPGKNPYYNLNAPHAYSVLNDWNQGTAMVQEQWHDVLRYWMTEYKFDGFRFDLVKGLGNNDSYANNGETATNNYNQSRIDRMHELQLVMDEINPDAYFINENLAGAEEENAMAEYGQLNWVNLNDAGCQYAMGYSERSNLNPMFSLQDGRLLGSTVSYLESHDEQRLAYTQNQYGAAGVKNNVENSMKRLGSAAAQMLMTPGAHMIWQFSEIGDAQNNKTDYGNNTDPKIVNWNLLNEPNHKGLYDCYARMMRIRNLNPELFGNKVNFSNNCGVSDWSKGRTLSNVNGDKEVYTVINPNVDSSITVKVDFKRKNNDFYSIASQSFGSYASFNAMVGIVTVPANSYVVIASQNLSGVDEIKADSCSDQLRAYGAEGTIVIDYAPQGAEIYSLDGKKIASDVVEGSVNVASGIYVVRSGETSLKIAVK